tara:strand:+ start:292 stop:414 length:123 start_codon:yes stop_codon:yes gene_type:complete
MLVSKEVVRLLSTNPPPSKKLIEIMKECALLFKVDWKPTD